MGESFRVSHNIDNYRMPPDPGRITQCSMFVVDEEEWIFLGLDNMEFETQEDGTEFTQFSSAFAILYETEEDPSNAAKFGKPFDYLVRQFDGTLNIITQEIWDKLS